MVLSSEDNGILKDKPQGTSAAASIKAAGRLGSDGMVNVCEPLIGVVIESRAKDADRPGPKGKEVGRVHRTAPSQTTDSRHRGGT